MSVAPPVRTLLAVSLGIALAGGVARAQSPGPDAALARASRGDSLAALDSLEALARQRPRDALVWHRKGMLAWGLSEGRRSAELQSQDVIRLTRSADTSLRIAVRQSPDSVRWAIDLMWYLLTSHVSSTRSAAWVVARDAITAAERRGDPTMISEARDAAGMAAWRNYETFSARPATNLSDGRMAGPVEMTEVRGDAMKRQAIVNRVTGDDAQQFGGEADYREAERQFAGALAANPESRAARRHYYMALATRQRWEELEHVARERAATAPRDAVSWLTLGLALHRTGRDENAAAAAFARGFALFAPAERARLTAITRLLAPRREHGDSSTATDSVEYAAASPEERAAIERRFWLRNDPLALTAVNEHRNEFYARVTYAELRWSVDELYVRGSETDRGMFYIRWGAPVYELRGNDSSKWYYAFDSVTFREPTGFGVGFWAREEAGDEWKFAERAHVWQDPPAAALDSVIVEVARFRGAADSAGLYVAARTRTGRLIGGVQRGSAAVDVGFLVADRDARPVLRDSARVRVGVVDAAADVRAWQASVPADDYLVRVEALGLASQRGARGQRDVSVHAATGFGVSDLLLAASVTPPGAATTRPRWTDYATVPDAGVASRGQSVALLWESYSLGGGADSVARYRVTVSVEPASRGAVADFTARVLAGAASVVGRRASSSDGRLSVSYDRQTPRREAIPDYLTLDLGDAPPGEYVVRLRVDDLVAHTTAASQSRLTVLP